MTSLTSKARLAGFLYLLTGIPSVFYLIYIPSALIAPGNATATADKIMASEALPDIMGRLAGALRHARIQVGLHSAYSKHPLDDLVCVIRCRQHYSIIVPERPHGFGIHDGPRRLRGIGDYPVAPDQGRKGSAVSRSGIGMGNRTVCTGLKARSYACDTVTPHPSTAPAFAGSAGPSLPLRARWSVLRIRNVSSYS